MVSGQIALIMLLIAVGIIVILTGKYKVNAFLVLTGVAIAYGLAIGLAPLEVIKLVKEGFGGTLTNIGIVIIAGTIMGLTLEKTGAALSMTRSILKLVGKERSSLAMNAAGVVVSIPVFCDSGFVIMNPLNQALAKESATSMVVMSVALATGLYATHTMVPPTPGPLAAAGALNADIGMVILYGMIASIPAALAAWFFATRIGNRFPAPVPASESYQTLIDRYGKLPSPYLSFLPIIGPLLLILGKSVADLPSQPFGVGGFASVVQFIGEPVVALIIGMFLSFTLLQTKKEWSEALSTWTNEGIKDAALILVITGAGGSLGKILSVSPLKDYVSTVLADPKLGLGLFLPFMISAALKTAQGSSTVAIITTSTIMAPLMATLGLHPALTVVVIGAGAMVVSHANDSYFWVVSQFSNLDVGTAYRVFTTATFVEGTVAFLVAWMLSFVV
ncbi:GntP family permease [Peredibacter sp. HCB2-198]|uniref:GntP family permease n=1 Tax=Peredibacter sp. HCB2-198 TaxID=3383025 RepID=UPI0038B611A4